MGILKRMLEKINGNKTTIATILGAILVFVQGRGWVAVDTATMVSVILVALGFTANRVQASINRENVRNALINQPADPSS